MTRQTKYTRRNAQTHTYAPTDNALSLSLSHKLSIFTHAQNAQEQRQQLGNNEVGGQVCVCFYVFMCCVFVCRRRREIETNEKQKKTLVLFQGYEETEVECFFCFNCDLRPAILRKAPPRTRCVVVCDVCGMVNVLCVGRDGARK